MQRLDTPILLSSDSRHTMLYGSNLPRFHAKNNVSIFRAETDHLPDYTATARKTTLNHHHPKPHITQYSYKHNKKSNQVPYDQKPTTSGYHYTIMMNQTHNLQKH
jgi:hypothetical protein